MGVDVLVIESEIVYLCLCGNESLTGKSGWTFLMDLL